MCILYAEQYIIVFLFLFRVLCYNFSLFYIAILVRLRFQFSNQKGESFQGRQCAFVHEQNPKIHTGTGILELLFSGNV